MSPEYLDIAIKVGSAWTAGSLIGLERSFHGRPAGVRTHALVAVASALLMLVTSYQWRWFGGASIDAVRIDPTRMAQGIMTGIGFLGAGVIFKDSVTVRGLTTAASIWTTAAVGILFGIGMYYTAALGTLLTLGILAAFRWCEALLPNELYSHLVLRYRRSEVPLETEVRQLLTERGFKVAAMGYDVTGDGTVFEYRTVIKTRKKGDAGRLAEHLRKTDQVLSFGISPAGD